MCCMQSFLGKHLNTCNTKNGEKRAAITRWCFYMYDVNNLAGNKNIAFYQICVIEYICFYVTVDRTTTARSALQCLLNGRQMTSVGGASPIARAESFRHLHICFSICIFIHSVRNLKQLWNKPKTILGLFYFSFITARCYTERGYEIACCLSVCPWRSGTFLTPVGIRK